MFLECFTFSNCLYLWPLRYLQGLPVFSGAFLVELEGSVDTASVNVCRQFFNNFSWGAIDIQWWCDLWGAVFLALRHGIWWADVAFCAYMLAEFLAMLLACPADHIIKLVVF